MTPASGAAARRASEPRAALAARQPAGPARRPVSPVDAPRSGEARRLRVVPPGPRRRRRIPEALGVLLLVGSLLAVVVGHAMLTSGSVRLSAEQARLAAAQATHRQEIVQVARLETPSRIVEQAEQQLHMVSPAQIDQVPHVSLRARVAAPGRAASPTSDETTGTGTVATPNATTSPDAAASGR